MVVSILKLIWHIYLHTNFDGKFQNFFSKDVEREFKASVKDRKVVKERLEVMETDVNHIMGRGDTSDVSGIPTLSRLLTDIDELNANKTKVTNDFDTFQTTMTEKLVEETKQVNDFFFQYSQASTNMIVVAREKSS